MISRTRISSTFQNLERLNVQCQASSRFGPDGVQQMRYATSKIQQLVTSQDRQNRDLIIKSCAYIEQLLTTLQNVSDNCTQQNIICILNELIGKTDVNKKVSLLVGAGITNSLFHVLVVESRNTPCPIDLLVSVHQLLIRIGPKDRKFCVKARLSQVLGVTLHLIRTYIGHTKIVIYLLQVLKLYSANAVNACYLGKNGAISHLFRILSLYGRKYLTHVRCTLDTLALLVRSKSNSARAIGHGGVRMMLNMFYDWNKADSKNRHINLRKAILIVMKHLTNLKSGRQALIDADGIRILYTSCQATTKCRELENLIFTSTLIMRKCFPKSHLPVESLRSPFSFSLPASDFHIIDDGEGQASAPLTRLTRMLQQLRTGGENGYESSVDNDDDISSDDDADLQKAMCAEEEDPEVTRDAAPYSRTWTDLSMYVDFFPEITEFDMQLDEDDLDPDSDPVLLSMTSDPIVRTSQWSGLCNSRSACSLPSMAKSTLSQYFTSPAASEVDSINMSIHDLHFPPRGINGSLQRSYSQLSKREMVLYSQNRSLGFFLDTTSQCLPQANAVNLKTGSSVFSLDVSSQPPSRQNTAGSALSKQGPSKLNPRAPLSPLLNPATPLPHRPDEWVLPRGGLTTGGFSIKPLSLKDRSDENSENYANSSSEDDYNSMFDRTEVYTDIAAQTRSVGRFNKVAYPDLHGHMPSPNKEELPEKKFGTQRKMIFEDIERFINTENILDRVVYDLDAIVAMAGPTYTTDYSNQSNRDKQRVEVPEGRYDHLMFNGQFESGNLRKATQIRENEYDLILSPDINTNHHHQWFYFEVRNMKAEVAYRFNIINCEKLNSQFNFGMKPVMFSVAEAVAGRPYWLRIGSNICYYKNHFMRSAETTGGVKGKSYYTTTFTVTFPHENDVCYLAYHFPYTYTMLQTHIHKWENTYNRSQIFFRSQNLCHTLSGNHFPLLTITALPNVSNRASIAHLKNRPYVFLTGRVHPGESNASWVMKGTIDFLMSDKPLAQSLRELYIFKVIPMLNPDGVINGNHRCSLVAEDLNRCWLRPCPKLHPTIFHSKGLLQYLYMINKSPLVYCDYHGHSRRKNVFLYGCSRNLSWLNDNGSGGSDKVDDGCYKILPRVLQHIAPAFSLSGCSFVVEKSKETTARVVVWRQFGIARSYTMESSYCGCDQGIYKNCFLGTRELEEMGRKFSEALYQLMLRHLQGTGSQSALRLNSSEEALSDMCSCAATTSTAVASKSQHDKKRRESLARSSSSDDDDLEDEDDDDDVDDDVLPEEEEEAGTAFQ